MIVSAVEDNWRRVELLNSLARDLYAATVASDARASILGSGPFCFDVSVYSTMQNEHRIVGMVMAWSVVTLETLANHQIASILNNKMLATFAIEYPQTIVEKLKLGANTRSELAKKLLILSDNDRKLVAPNGTLLVQLAETLADIRNRIVHDKPYRFTQLPEGDVVVDYFRIRGEDDTSLCRYDELSEFYGKCDLIAKWLVNLSPENLDCNLDFTTLMSG